MLLCALGWRYKDNIDPYKLKVDDRYDRDIFNDSIIQDSIIYNDVISTKLPRPNLIGFDGYVDRYTYDGSFNFKTVPIDFIIDDKNMSFVLETDEWVLCASGSIEMIDVNHYKFKILYGWNNEPWVHDTIKKAKDYMNDRKKRQYKNL